jgi:hypothetical protein
MGVSALGEGIHVSTVRYALATAMVFLGLFYYLYGPPLTQRMSEAAHRECNQLTGSTYRTYQLQWVTTTYSSVHVPQWICYDTSDPADRGTSLGWWVSL